MLLVGFTTTLAAVLVADAIPAGASHAASTVIDRTVVCTTGSFNGLRGIHAGGSSRQEGNGVPAEVDASSDVGFAEIAAGEISGRPEGVRYNVKRCRLTKIRVPLSARGLSGGAAPLGADARCETGKRVLLHLHAVMESRPVWTLKGQIRTARGKPLQGAIAVRTYPGRKPLAFVTVDAPTAVAKVYSAASCF